MAEGVSERQELARHATMHIEGRDRLQLRVGEPQSSCQKAQEILGNKGNIAAKLVERRSIDPDYVRRLEGDDVR